jgi:signal transduction histidine kinase
MTMDRHGRTIGRALLDTIWQVPLWAIPFALFFGTMFGGRPESYLWAYGVSLIFALTIRLALILLTHLVLPRLKRASPDGCGAPLPVEIALFSATCLLASYVAGFIVHLTILPDFLGSPRAVLMNGMYALLFSTLIGGIAYAAHFYRQSITRMRAVESMRAELAQAELRALKAQLEPHFLFNTLNAIASLIPSNPAAAEEMTTRLADVFRYALSASERETAPLADELAFAHSYLDIERVRFGDRLRVITTVEPGLERAPVPSLLLQPVVENAVRHAIAPRAEGGTIRLSAKRAGGALLLTVEDDGPGIDAATAARILEGGNGARREPGSRGFGLFALRERLRAAGLEHALALSTPPGGGTRVTITLPYTST